MQVFVLAPRHVEKLSISAVVRQYPRALKLTLNREKTFSLLTRTPQLTVFPATGGSLNTRAVNSMSFKFDRSESTGDSQTDLALPYHQLVVVRGKSGMCFSLSAGIKQRQPTWSTVANLVRNDSSSRETVYTYRHIPGGSPVRCVSSPPTRIKSVLK